MLLWPVQLRRDKIDDCSCEFPSVHPYRHVGQHGVAGSRFVYLMANDRGKNLPYQDVVKVCQCNGAGRLCGSSSDPLLLVPAALSTGG